MSGQSIQRIAIIGGGPSGLAATYRLSELRPDADVTLFEASSRLGGLIETVHLDGFLIERGADSFISTKPAGVNLAKRLGLEDELITPNNENRRSLIVRDGKPVGTPDNFHLLVPRSVQSVLDSELLSTSAKLRFLQEAAIPQGHGGEESLAGFTRRRFGAEFLEKIVQPITAGIYSADPEELSMAASLPQFLAMEREYGSLIAAGAVQRRAAEDDASGARYGLFVSFAEGMQRMIDVLAKAVDKHATVRMEQPVTAIERADEGWTVSSSDEQEVFDAVIVALPAFQAEKLLRTFDVGPIDEIPAASSAIVVTGHRKADVAHNLDAFGMVVPFCEERPVTAVSFASEKFPGRTPEGCVLLRTFIGGPHGRHLLSESHDTLVNTATKQLGELLGVQGEPMVALVADYPDASPQYTLGHLDRVAAIEEAVAQHDCLELAGASYRGVGFPDAIASGEAAVERLAAVSV